MQFTLIVEMSQTDEKDKILSEIFQFPLNAELAWEVVLNSLKLTVNPHIYAAIAVRSLLKTHYILLMDTLYI